eukprot:GHVP01009332.1.p1 GENE.GHVP01009332.1~~GHVP01009332.1.p1  ORF type:complete len:939 (-),score=128.22 GHVP01009332.1:2172-4988(-)
MLDSNKPVTTDANEAKNVESHSPTHNPFDADFQSESDFYSWMEPRGSKFLARPIEEEDSDSNASIGLDTFCSSFIALIKSFLMPLESWPYFLIIFAIFLGLLARGPSSGQLTSTWQGAVIFLSLGVAIFIFYFFFRKMLLKLTLCLCVENRLVALLIAVLDPHLTFVFSSLSFLITWRTIYYEDNGDYFCILPFVTQVLEKSARDMADAGIVIISFLAIRNVLRSMFVFYFFLGFFMSTNSSLVKFLELYHLLRKLNASCVRLTPLLREISKENEEEHQHARRSELLSYRSNMGGYKIDINSLEQRRHSSRLSSNIISSRRGSTFLPPEEGLNSPRRNSRSTKKYNYEYNVQYTGRDLPRVLHKDVINLTKKSQIENLLALQFVRQFFIVLFVNGVRVELCNKAVTREVGSKLFDELQSIKKKILAEDLPDEPTGTETGRGFESKIKEFGGGSNIILGGQSDQYSDFSDNSRKGPFASCCNFKGIRKGRHRSRRENFLPAPSFGFDYPAGGYASEEETPTTAPWCQRLGTIDECQSGTASIAATPQGPLSAVQEISPVTSQKGMTAINIPEEYEEEFDAESSREGHFDSYAEAPYDTESLASEKKVQKEAEHRTEPPGNLAAVDEEVLTRDVLEMFLKSSEIDDFMKLADYSGHGKITKSQFIRLVTQAYVERKNLNKIHETSDGIKKIFNQVISIFLSCIFLICFLIYVGLDINTLIVSGAALISTIVVVFGFLYSSFVQSVMFVIFINPYNVGDRVRVDDGGVLIVKNINTLASQFETTTGKPVFINHTTLLQNKITNESRCTNSSFCITLWLHDVSGPAKFESLKIMVENYVLSKPEEFVKDSYCCYVSGGQPGNYLAIEIWVTHVEGWWNWRIVWQAKGDLTLFIARRCMQLRCTYSLPVQKWETVGPNSKYEMDPPPSKKKIEGRPPSSNYSR